jgi:hypothetical protein
MTRFSRILKTALLVLAVAVAAGCSGSYQRGMFQGYVVGIPADEIQSKIGKPDSVDESDPNKPRWVYNKKTFDPDNFNKQDEKTIVILERKDGKLVGVDVLFG